MQLEEMTTTDVKEHLKKDTLIVIPVGSVEQHGPANPLGTDYMLATHVARKACEQVDVICAPPMPIGISQHHNKFAGTLWFSHRLFAKILMQYALSLAHHGFDHIVFINGHGGNTGVLQEVTFRLYADHKIKAATVNWYEMFDNEMAKELFPKMNLAHAEAIETSSNLGAHPHLVKLDRVPGITSADSWGKTVAGRGVPGFTHEFAPDGVVGSLDDISEESGKKILDSSISAFVEFLKEFREY